MASFSFRRSEYLELIKCVPLDTADFVFAYGSGAISQANENMKDKMVDFIIVTNDPLKFHTDNIDANPNHYSAIRHFGPNAITKFQTRMAARVFYNTQITSMGRTIKYGVISTDNILQDLLDWSWLYVAGRMQKPVLNVLMPTEKIKDAVRVNRVSALQFGLLMVGDTFTYEDLFKQIVSLSYNGDFRQIIGEDRDKVQKIVTGGMDRFIEIYNPLLIEDPRITVLSNKIEQDNTTPAIFHRINLLPSGVLNNVQELWKKKYKERKDVEETLFSLAHRSDVDTIIQNSVSSIVAKSSRNQTVKNAFSAGVVKSFIYSSAKFFKMIKSIR
uniref:Phosphatidate cytidylyltransferase, mitochondrial n=1 Tax=Rhabditophanes sp. KR3021 TaxID=114890 RepID=A0AC35TTX8_9BILA